MININKFDELVSTDIPSPNDVESVYEVKSNGQFSIIKKADGTLSIRNEHTKRENGHFLTLEEAEAEYEDVLLDR